MLKRRQGYEMRTRLQNMRKHHIMSHKESTGGKNLLGHEFATPQMSETSAHKRQNTAVPGQR